MPNSGRVELQVTKPTKIPLSKVDETSFTLMNRPPSEDGRQAESKFKTAKQSQSQSQNQKQMTP